MYGVFRIRVASHEVKCQTFHSRRMQFVQALVRAQIPALASFYKLGVLGLSGRLPANWSGNPISHTIFLFFVF